jgi:UDP-N-acetylglucosamine--N-acetylmuramyl-(pentapeptide) pyrophosphoryl-undecaprenol N-acetylglucosamine transferase
MIYGRSDMKKIVLTGGGTAGHVIPNLAIVPELKKKFSET